MELTILGCSGSAASSTNPASGYLITRHNQLPVVVDLGPGTLAKLQGYVDPAQCDVIFSHLHADHCLDFPSLLVWRRYHPTKPSPSKNFLAGPSYTESHLGPLSSDVPGEIDRLGDTFDFQPLAPHRSFAVGQLTFTPYPMIHPVETYALRVVDEETGQIFCYSADSAATEQLLAAAQDADYFFCEATWGYSSAGKAPGMHMSGQDAGKIAAAAGVKTLVLVHIPPWGDAAGAVRGAREFFGGQIIVGQSGQQYR